MNGLIKGCVGLGLLLAMAIAAPGAEGTASQVSVQTNATVLAKQRYDLILANLDAGGDLLVVANMEGWIRDAVQGIVKPVLAVGGDNPGFAPVATCLGKLPEYLSRCGLYGFQGFGVSIVPRADGLNTVKSFMARDPEVTWSPLWRATVGGNPRKIACADFIPADAEFARTGTGEGEALWKMIRSGVAELATPAAAAAFNAQLAALSTNAGVNLDKVFESTGSEEFFSVQFSKSEVISLPGGEAGAPLTMPKPSLLMGVAVKDDTLVAALESALAKGGLTVTNLVGSIKTINLPFPIPVVPFQPSYTVHAGTFLFGSTPGVVAGAVSAFDGKSGLVSTPAFAKAFTGLPMVNNGIAYLSPRFMSIIMDMQTAMAAHQPGGEGQMVTLLNELAGCKRNMMAAEVILNKRNGVETMGVSSMGAKEMAASMLMAPVGMMAAVAVPSFVRARGMAKGNVCVNNLLMIEAAKEQWSLENDKKPGDTVPEAELVKYLGEGEMPKCPQGGRYTINALGKKAKCSHPGHQLPN